MWNVNSLAEGVKSQTNATTGKYSDKFMPIKILLLSCSDFFPYSYSLFFPKNMPILILHYCFSWLFFFFLGSKIFSILSFTAIPFVVCPSLLTYLLISKYCWHTLWFFPTFFSCSSFLLLSLFFLPHLVMPFCLLPSFIIIDIPVTLDLFCKDHKAVRPLSRWKPKQNWLWRWSNEKGSLLGSFFCLWSVEEGCLVLSFGCTGEPARS